MPVVPNKPETAPMYDEVRKVQVMPRIMGGYCAGGECRCYIQYGLRAPIDPKACFDWIRDPPFDPYYAPPQPTQARQPSAPASGAATTS
jgi:zona occludens toxin